MKKIKADKDAVARAKRFLITTSESSSTPFGRNMDIAPKPAIRVLGPAGKPPSLKVGWHVYVIDD